MSDVVAAADASEGGVSLEERLQHVVHCVRKAHPMLSKTLCGQVGLSVELSNSPSLCLLERLKVVHRTLEEAYALSRAQTEDALIEVTLQQHEQALAQRVAAETNYERERDLTDNLRRQVAKLERELGKDDRSHKRLEEVSGAERAVAVEQRRAEAQSVRDDTAAEATRLREQLSKSIGTKRDLEEHIRQLDEEHDAAMEQNACAQKVLGTHLNLEAFRRTKEGECFDEDASLHEMQEECEAELTRLSADWQDEQSRFKADMSELELEAASLRELMEAKSSEAERLLRRQAEQTARTLQETQDRTIAEKLRLQELRAEKKLAAETEIGQGGLQVSAAREGVTRSREQTTNEMSVLYNHRVKSEEKQFNEVIKQERQAVLQTQQYSKRLGRHVDKVRTDYKGHVVKSGAYVRSMDPRRKSKVMEFWTKT